MKTRTDAENTLIEVMRNLGPASTSCEGCSYEIQEALDAVHKYFGQKRVKEIYKEELGYVWPPTEKQKNVFTREHGKQSCKSKNGKKS